jgi:hypothetical protein
MMKSEQSRGYQAIIDHNKEEIRNLIPHLITHKKAAEEFEQCLLLEEVPSAEKLSKLIQLARLVQYVPWVVSCPLTQRRSEGPSSRYEGRASE